MSLTPWQLETRQKYLTASSLAAVFGMDPYRSAADVLAEKLMPMMASNAGEAAARGLRIEPHLIEWCASNKGLSEIRRNQWRVSDNGVNAATFDAIGLNGVKVGIEAKTSGIANPWAVGEEWGEDGTDKVPPRVLIQCVGQLIAAPDVQRIYVAALLGGIGERIYQIDRSTRDVAELIGEIADRSVAWWNDHVMLKVPLPESEAPPALETLKRIIRAPASEIDLRNDPKASAVIEAWQAAAEARKAAAMADEAAKARALALLGTHEAALVRVGGELKQLKYMTQNRQAYTVAACEFRVAKLVKAN